MSFCIVTLLFIIPRTVLLSSLQPEAETLDSSTMHFREVFRKSSHHVNTNKGGVVTQSGNDVEGCRSQKVLFQPNMCVFLQYNVKIRTNTKAGFPVMAETTLTDNFHTN